MEGIVHDPIYHFSDDIILDNCAIEILQTPEFVRLKGIKQAGITGLFTVRSYDRAEHSIGVYLLLRYLGATTEQCIGGLLHDIYHTNFSHTTDELFCGEKQESFHEKNKFVFFDRCCGNIKDILATYFPTRDALYFLEGENMMVTKNKSFGADMLDYFIRDGFYEGVITSDWVAELIRKIKLVDGRIILTDITMAKEFFNKTIYINDTVYMSPFSRGQYKIFICILRHALNTKIITADQLIYGYNSDAEVYNCIKANGDDQIKELIELLETTTEYSFCGCGDKWKKTSAKITRKLRFLNPLCNSPIISNSSPEKPQVSEAPQPVSELDTDVNTKLREKHEQYSRQEELYVETTLNAYTKV